MPAHAPQRPFTLLLTLLALGCSGGLPGLGGSSGGGGSSSSGGASSSGAVGSSSSSSSSGGGTNRPVGSACTSAADCADGACLDLPSGYCTLEDCLNATCPAGSTCFQLSAGGSACFVDCTSPAQCRVSEGYTCDADNTCYPGMAPECGPQNLNGLCSNPNEVCVNGNCQVFMCTDMRNEPNEVLGSATTVTEGTITGLALCAQDVDWFKMEVPPKTIGTVGATFQHSAGDLDLTLHSNAGNCLGGRLFQSCVWSRYQETGEEFLSVINNAESGVITNAWKLTGYSGAANQYALKAELTPWTDGRDCSPTYTSDECEGRPNGVTSLIQFPLATAEDPYVGDGYRFDSASNYRWLRRETMMLVRYAIHETQLQFPGTKPLGLIDMCQRDGITPGYDVEDPRHPESTHDQGGNIDIAYYTTLASNGSLAYNEARIICDASEGNDNGSFCNASAATTHVVDLPRQVYFMAKLFESPRIRVIGADQVIAPLLVAEADRQLQMGIITQAQRNKFTTSMASGGGWPFHHHHIHVSLDWWGSLEGKPGPHAGRDGCGFDLRRHRVRD